MFRRKDRWIAVLAFVIGFCLSSFASAGSRKLGSSCNGNSDCASNTCDAGWGTSQTNTCVPRQGKGKTGEYCTNHKWCKSNSCSGHNKPPRHKGTCVGKSSVNLGSHCDGNSDCKSGTCDIGNGTSKTSLCVPRPGTGSTGTFCTNNKYCKSGMCSGHSKSGHRGTCIGKATVNLGNRCSTHAECKSGTCDIGNGTSKTSLCVPRPGTGTTNTFCTNHKYCKSGICTGHHITGHRGKCINKSTIALGAHCGTHQECKSGTCDMGDGTSKTLLCVPKPGTGSTGTFCTNNKYCKSGICSGHSKSGHRGTCISKSTISLGKTCSTHTECKSGTCDIGWETSKTSLCVPKVGTGKTGTFCTHNKYCQSGSCSGHNTLDHRGKCVQKATISLGKTCQGHTDCKSGTCDIGNGTSKTSLCVPKPGTGSTGTFCTNNKYCQSGSCSGHNKSGHRGTCVKKATVSLGKTCQGHTDCKSGTCDIGWGTSKTSLCVPKPGTAKTGTFCTHDKYCQSGSCSGHNTKDHRGKCLKKATVSLGKTCSGHTDCKSGTCDIGNETSKTSLCVPKPGSGKTGTFCTNNKYCKSGRCSGHNQKGHRGKCIAKGTRELAEACSANDDCKSNTCDLGNETSKTGLCVPPVGKGTEGTFCTNNKYCDSGYCSGHSIKGHRGKCGIKNVASRCPKSSSCKPGKCGLSGSLVFKKLNKGKNNLRGVVDLHTHPMSHLAFGGKVLHGAPGVDVLMPSGSMNCNATPRRARSVDDALGSCYSTHGGHDVFKNKCGDHIRRLVLNGFEDGNHANKAHDVPHPEGTPTFNRWPKHNDLLHQIMFVDWLERAHQGGMRVMVVLAVNNITLAKGVNGNKPYDDKSSGDLQLKEIKRWAGRSNFMEIAKSPADLRRIVGNDKLALVLGVELDDMGSMVWNRKDRGNQPPTEAAVKAEIRRLHEAGVRYIFPVHVIDNYFGGTAIYEDNFSRANRYHWGKWWKVACATKADGIKHKVSLGWDPFVSVKLGAAGGTQPAKSCKYGHKNSRGLTGLGKVALTEMMQLGMLIDIDHMSNRTVEGVLAYTETRKYPLMSGHSGLRGLTSDAENAHTVAQYQEIKSRGGLAGLGFADTDASKWLKDVNATFDEVGDDLPFAIGTDANGFAALPPPHKCKNKNCIKYSSKFPKACFQGRSWDYNIDGVAHYGLLPDFFRDVEAHGGKKVIQKLFNGAEAFAKAWEAAERASKTKFKPSVEKKPKKIRVPTLRGRKRGR